MKKMECVFKRLTQIVNLAHQALRVKKVTRISTSRNLVIKNMEQVILQKLHRVLQVVSNRVAVVSNVVKVDTGLISVLILALRTVEDQVKLEMVVVVNMEVLGSKRAAGLLEILKPDLTTEEVVERLMLSASIAKRLAIGLEIVQTQRSNSLNTKVEATSVSKENNDLLNLIN